MALIERRHQGSSPFKRSFWNELLSNEMNLPSILKEGEALPAINIRETESSYELELAAPGYKKEDFKVNIENGLLSIKAEIKEEREETSEQYSRKEFSYRSFERAFALPDSVNEDAIQGKYDNGVLCISLPKLNREELPEPKKTVNIS